MIKLIKIKLNYHDFYIINDKAIKQLKSEYKHNELLQLLALNEGYKQIGVEFLTVLFYKNFEDWEVIRDLDVKTLLVFANKEALEKLLNISINETKFTNYEDFLYNTHTVNNAKILFKQCPNCGVFMYNYYDKNQHNVISDHYCTSKWGHPSLQTMYELSLHKQFKSKFAKNKKKRQLMFDTPIPIQFPLYRFYLNQEKEKKQKKSEEIAKKMREAMRTKKQLEKQVKEQNQINFIDSYSDKINFNKIDISENKNNLKLYIETTDEYLIDVINSYNIESPIEQMLYQKLYQITCFKVIPQYETCGYKIDFIIKDKENNNILAIKCDGYEYHSSKEAMLSDYKRQRELQANGFTFMRFLGTEIYNNVNDCTIEIIKYYQKLK